MTELPRRTQRYVSVHQLSGYTGRAVRHDQPEQLDRLGAVAVDGVVTGTGKFHLSSCRFAEATGPVALIDVTDPCARCARRTVLLDDDDYSAIRHCDKILQAFDQNIRIRDALIDMTHETVDAPPSKRAALGWSAIRTLSRWRGLAALVDEADGDAALAAWLAAHAVELPEGVTGLLADGLAAAGVVGVPAPSRLRAVRAPTAIQTGFRALTGDAVPTPVVEWVIDGCEPDTMPTELVWCGHRWPQAAALPHDDDGDVTRFPTPEAWARFRWETARDAWVASTVDWVGAATTTDTTSTTVVYGRASASIASVLGAVGRVETVTVAVADGENHGWYVAAVPSRIGHALANANWEFLGDVDDVFGQEDLAVCAELLRTGHDTTIVLDTVHAI